jgi:hypothetical protein
VLEVPDVTVTLSSGRRAWTYGTVGVGVDYGPMIWKEHEHVFLAHSQQTTHALPTTALNLGSPQRLKPDFLDQHPVECLLVEGDSATRWIPWVANTKPSNRPSAILSFLPADALDQDEGPVPKAQRKALNKLGYEVRYWYLKAWDFGAALDLSTVCMVWYRTVTR